MVVVGGLLKDKSVDDIRLIWKDLNGDKIKEAVIIISDFSRVEARILQEGEQGWFQIAELSAWFKYESDFLETFIEVSDSGEIVVRASTGGTGIYARDLTIYRIKDSSLVEVLLVTEERFRDCPAGLPTDSPPKDFFCQVVLKEIRRTYWQSGSAKMEPSEKAIVVEVFSGNLEPESAAWGASKRPVGWTMLPTKSCRAYLWSETGFRYMLDANATVHLCPYSNQ